MVSSSSSSCAIRFMQSVRSSSTEASFFLSSSASPLPTLPPSPLCRPPPRALDFSRAPDLSRVLDFESSPPRSLPKVSACCSSSSGEKPSAKRSSLSERMSYSCETETPSMRIFPSSYSEYQVSIQRGKEASCTVTIWKRSVQLDVSKCSMRKMNGMMNE